MHQIKGKQLSEGVCNKTSTNREKPREADKPPVFDLKGKLEVIQRSFLSGMIDREGFNKRVKCLGVECFGETVTEPIQFYFREIKA